MQASSPRRSYGRPADYNGGHEGAPLAQDRLDRLGDRLGPVLLEAIRSQNFLFFCDLGNLFITLALWLESPLIFSWQATGLLLFQTLYTIDLVGAFSTGWHIVGGTEYMFD